MTNGGYASLRCVHSHCNGFSCCGAQALRTRAQELWLREAHLHGTSLRENVGKDLQKGREAVLALSKDSSCKISFSTQESALTPFSKEKLKVKDIHYIPNTPQALGWFFSVCIV